MRSQAGRCDWPVIAGMPNGRLFFERSCHVSSPRIISRNTALSISNTHNSRASDHLHTRNLWMSLGNTLSLPPPPSFEGTHTGASAHSSDWLMNLNRRGFRCLDHVGEETESQMHIQVMSSCAVRFYVAPCFTMRSREENDSYYSLLLGSSVTLKTPVPLKPRLKLLVWFSLNLHFARWTDTLDNNLGLSFIIVWVAMKLVHLKKT